MKLQWSRLRRMCQHQRTPNMRISYAQKHFISRQSIYAFNKQPEWAAHEGPAQNEMKRKTRKKIWELFTNKSGLFGRGSFGFEALFAVVQCSPPFVRHSLLFPFRCVLPLTFSFCPFRFCVIIFLLRMFLFILFCVCSNSFGIFHLLSTLSLRCLHFHLARARWANVSVENER